MMEVHLKLTSLKNARDIPVYTPMMMTYMTVCPGYNIMIKQKFSILAAICSLVKSFLKGKRLGLRM